MGKPVIDGTGIRVELMLEKLATGEVDGADERRLLLGCGVEPARNVSRRDQERMARGDGEGVPLDRGALPVVLGGDHSITFPVVRAYQEPVHVVHFDAHLDYAPFVHDVQFSNSHPFRHVRKLSQVSSLAQIGIRSLRDGREMMEDALRDRNRVVTMDEFREQGPAGVADSVPRDARCYVSIDVDVLDLPLVPGCVSAEPNGMSFRELTETLKTLAERVDVVGFDLVEVNPQLDVGTGVTSYVAAHIVIEFLGRICDQPRWVERRGASRRS